MASYVVLAKDGGMNQTQERPAGNSEDDPGPQVNRARLQDVGGLRRSHSDRYIAGVAGGLGRHFGIDPTIIRVALVAMCVFGGAGLLIYAAVWLFVPEEGRDRAPIHVGDDILRLVLLVAIALAAISVIGNPWWGMGGNGSFWVIGIIAIAAAIFLSSSRRTGREAAAEAPQPDSTTASTTAQFGAPPPTSTATGPTPPAAPPATPPIAAPPAAAPAPAPRPRRTGVVLFWPTIALIALGSGALGIYADQHHVIASAWPALALAIIGIMLVVGAFVARPGGLILIGLLTLPPLLATSVVENFHWERQPVTYTPASAAGVQDSYQISNGRMTIDLSTLTDPAGLTGRTIIARMNAGEIVVYLPRGLATKVDGTLDAVGDVQIDGREQSGFAPSVTTTIGTTGQSAGVLTLDVHGRVGRIDVQTR